jgi:DNA-binding HxlR family transcriptional regulator
MAGTAPNSSTNGAGPSRAAATEAAGKAASVCPYFHEAVELVGKRWTGAIVNALLPGPLRFSALSQAVPQISDRLLSMRLKELETFGIVARRVHEGAPVRVEYELTEKGRALEPTVRALGTWAREWLKNEQPLKAPVSAPGA